MRASANVVADLLESAPTDPPPVPLLPKREASGRIDPSTGDHRPNLKLPAEPAHSPPPCCESTVRPCGGEAGEDVLMYLALGAALGLALSYLLSPSIEPVPLMRRLSIDSVSSASM